MPREKSSFGKKLEAAMYKKGMGTGDLARELGVSVSVVSDFKVREKPQPATVFRCAQILGVEVEDLIDLSEVA